ncbi:hypothetical protein EMIHUDRAFT_198437 [Emiliania huxleyi CCMP1516]|uniref:PHD-type domain-containing protein n=2 Tax=Emiliania huxleyi TaxID=2903 RepID=A0A0D3I797_EMIH1|nr:hypothetical protein EMIHUDRAFT_198437 [Emiliania huxleyi CCMP1516]EOD07132.1 hypothetical protein EMIHUDRAFT_198437 [Emiliania huxleyi CCMP1516]|eukprot:XP_005759561.1 hypothetical protein EMIHUDRAFT_198437 [Emiliania huxleyi CCMP1516]
MLLCDTCDRGYHTTCLSPPAHCAGDRAGTTRLIDLRNHSKFPAGFTLLSFLDWSSLREMEKRLNRSLSMAEYWEFRILLAQYCWSLERRICHDE